MILPFFQGKTITTDDEDPQYTQYWCDFYGSQHFSNGEMVRKSQGIEGHRCLDALPEHRSQRGFQDQPGGRKKKKRRLAMVKRDEGVTG